MNKKISIALVVLIVLSMAFVACSKNAKDEEATVTQVVTDENGEAVTDENGEVVTELVTGSVVTDAEGSTVTEVVTNAQGEKITNSQGGDITQVVTKTPNGSTKNDTTVSTIPMAKKPADVSKLKVSNITQTSVKLTWSSVKCDGYQISYRVVEDGSDWKYLEEDYSKTSYTVSKLTSYTKYEFRVRAFNKNKVGNKSGSKWKESGEITTKANEEISRKIKVSVILPNNGGIEETVTVYVNGKKDGTITAKLDGSTISYTTVKKYKGVANVKASLKSMGYARAVNTDKESCEIDFSNEGIKILDGEDD